MKKALIHVDYTHDFVAENGALTAGPNAIAIFDQIMDKTKQFVEEGEYLVFAIDTHQKDDPFHPESRLFPPHNLLGTKGHQLYSGLEDYYQSIKEKENVYYLNKTRYSAFAGTDLHLKLRERKIEELYLLGVCTDICVLHTAIDAYNLGYSIKIFKNCVTSFNSQGHLWALEHFKNCLGAELL
ncbi:cysteine hydrolase [Facklamia sp. DSM 111018]|uniref:Cysteine hydrolase n=1 Tax=Facklamia lactis TaxID=2749967 RepID=A0ABS0LPZ4_9LACT|nr:isochorismatase family cysteine hydrolase [Facklamia lactis]MBG9979879.1 cysteine hydrolase [Facklamia lactis]MBG9985441.1 cysteine hydrolase [Facklamia lactis]